MKVLHVNTFDIGGAAQACKRIDSALKNYGVQSNILYRNKTNKSDPIGTEIYSGLSLSSKLKHLLNQKLTDARENSVIKKIDQKELFSFYRSQWDITKSDQYKNADIIHLHWVSGFVNIPSILSMKPEKPMFWTLHDFAPFNNGLHYPVEGSEKINAAISINKSLISKPIRNNLSIISPSTFLLNESKRSENFKNLPHYHVENCSNTTFFRPQSKVDSRKELNLPVNKQIILFIAQNNNYHRKGLHILTQAIELLKNQDTIIVSIGNHKFNTLANNHIHINYFDNEELLCKYYNAADIFVLPSLLENFPNTVSESLCTGTPVVAFQVGGVPEMISEGENGFLAKEQNPENLSDAMNAALEKTWNRDNISKNAFIRYNGEICAKKHIKLYEKSLLI